ncbi:uncharacterized protein LOC124123907 [Haliotis rufescens]|uniref:uncharacterized protein LOC124123907 n=1 Tax=Haliotis rufescens TaxID=6454 RepID=UPI00201F2CBE|nr:uncharacterized protein LOC124123907 [Haliotis rufescens]
MGSDIHDTIEEWTTQHGVTAMFFHLNAFERSLTGLMEKTLQKNQLHIYRKLFNFVVFCDGINNCLPRITHMSSKKDKECGQGTLLRHFSKWLFLNVDPPLLTEVYADLDNIAIAVKWDPFCKKSASSTNGSIVYTHICKDFFDSFAEYLNFTYELIEPPDRSWGELSETWSGLLGMVARNVRREYIDLNYLQT